MRERKDGDDWAILHLKAPWQQIYDTYANF